MPATPIFHSPAPTPGTRTPSYQHHSSAKYGTPFYSLNSDIHSSSPYSTSTSPLRTTPIVPRSSNSSRRASICHETLSKNIIINKDPFPIQFSGRFEGTIIIR